jgi:hypothetical protein
MTASIERDTVERALQPSAVDKDKTSRSSRLVVGIWVFGTVAAAGGLVLVGLDLAHPHSLRYAVYAGACLVVAGICGGLICLRAMLAGCQEFYRRGQLDGWMRGWRGQCPDVDDPLLR